MSLSAFFFFFNDTATTEIYTLSLHDALPIFRPAEVALHYVGPANQQEPLLAQRQGLECCRVGDARSEEHTSELQSRLHLVCRLLLEKKKKREPQLIKTPRQH